MSISSLKTPFATNSFALQGGPVFPVALLGALPLAEGEGVRSTLLQGHVNSRENQDLMHVKLCKKHDVDMFF